MRDTGNVRSNPRKILGGGSRTGNEVGHRDDYESHARKSLWQKRGFRYKCRMPAEAEEQGLRHQLSADNGALYAASRVLFSLARTGWAPSILGRLSASGSPKPALLASSFGIVVALVLEKWAPKNAFVSILGAALVGMLLSWLVSLAAHVKFRQTVSASQLAALRMRSPLGAWGSALGFVLIIVAILETGWTSHLALISGAVYLVVLTAAYFLLKK